MLLCSDQRRLYGAKLKTRNRDEDFQGCVLKVQFVSLELCFLLCNFPPTSLHFFVLILRLFSSQSSSCAPFPKQQGTKPFMRHMPLLRKRSPDLLHVSYTHI
jgi:hypothetical protein